jgi:hypothetical protein
MENVRPGSILINSSTNKLYGVLVTTLPNNKIIVFRLEKNTHPIFSKLDVHPHIAKVGIINEFQYSTLKNALLKYYRTYNLTPSEKKMMQPLMNFAFPIGIPEYQPNIDLPERDIELMDLHSKLVTGNRIMINTPNKSCNSHLNNKTVEIIDKTDNGIWINIPNNEQDFSKLGNSMSFLFYKNRETPTFSGISRITPIHNDGEEKCGSNSSSSNSNHDKAGKAGKDVLEGIEGINGLEGIDSLGESSSIIDAYKKLKANDDLTTMMEFNGEKVRIIPSTRKVIFPDIYRNMIYNPTTDNFTIEKENITPSLVKKLGNKLIISGSDNTGNLMEINSMDNEFLFKGGGGSSGGSGGSHNTHNTHNTHNSHNENSTVNINEDGDLVYEGGGKKIKIVDKEQQKYGNDIYDNYEEDINDIENYEKSISKYESLFPSIDDDEQEQEQYNSVNSARKFSEDDDEDEQEFLNSSGKDKNSDKSKRKRLLSNTTNSESEYDENEFEEIIDEDDIQIQDTFQKVKKVELGNLEKVYKESTQKGDLLKYKLEQLPIFKRNNFEIINNIKKKINILTLLKNNINETISGIKQINFKPQDYKPLVSKYIKGDFTNKYIIPLVINRKKIYLNKNTKIDKEEYDLQSTEIIENFYDTIKDISYIQDKKNVSLNNDVYTQKIINQINPTSINDTDSIGMLFRLGDKLPLNDYSKLFQDTITINYCDKPMKCQSYSLDTMNFDYQVNLGAMGRFIESEQDLENPVRKYSKNEEQEQDLENPARKHSTNNYDGDENDGDDDNGNDDGDDDNGNDDNGNDGDNDGDKKKDATILYSKPKFKIYYPGDLIRIIGYVRPPLNYFCSPETNILKNLYKLEKKKHNVITINLKDINPEVIDENADTQFDITQNPDSFIIFLLPQEDFKYNNTNIKNQIDKIIPSISDIIQLYLNNKENKSIDSIYDILSKFEYDYNELTFDIYNKITKESEEYTNLYIKLNDKLKSKFELYKKDVIKNKKIKEENEKKFKNRIIQTETKTNAQSKFKYITDDIMDDISNFYFNTYDNKDISVDSDEIRLKWFQKNFDNGRFLFKTLLINYLKMYQESHNIENLETELSIIKEKHIMMSNSMNMMAINGSVNSANSIQDLKTRNTSPNIIKYPSLERLEKDNGKVAIDSDGSVIMTGDYALVDSKGGDDGNDGNAGGNTTKQLFRREVIGSIDMWIKEDISILYKLIQDKRNSCMQNPDIKLDKDKDHLYDFDMDRLKCIPKDSMELSIDSMSEKHKVELTINDLQKEIDYIKNIPIIIAKLNKEIINDRMYLVNKVNSLKKTTKNKEEEYKKLEEHIKSTLLTVKPCIHFKIVDHFHKITSEKEKYIFADTILKQFENTDIQNDSTNVNSNINNTNENINASINDYTTFNKKDNTKNFTYCNICNQKLLCNHHKLIVSYLNNINKMKNIQNMNNMQNVDYDKIVDIYGVEQDGSYVCNACNISIATTEILDLEDFTKGEDGNIIKTREITKDIPIIEKQKEYINNIIKTLFEKDDKNKEVLKQRLNIFTLMKKLSNLEMLSIKDEVDMLNFLKSYQFDKKDTIFYLVQSKIGNKNIALLKKIVDTTYLNYLIADIGVRFLITLQTSTVNYKIQNTVSHKINETYNESNNKCNSNIIGYPLINNLDAKDGINYMMCLFSQMALLPEYSILNDYKETLFIEKIKKQVENDNLLKEKIQSSLESKSNIVDNVNEFETYHTNYWREYKPRLEYSEITWHPEKLLNSANLKEITYNNINKMINVGIENTIYYSLNVINKINTVIDNSNKTNYPILLNNCCPEKKSNHYFNYMDYFYKQNSDILKNTNLFKEVNNILSYIKNISHNPINNIIYESLYKPSQFIYKVEFNVSNDEIKDMYLKYIDSGLNKGKVHIYDKYGRCILSNIKRSDIESQSYSLQDYKRIEESVNSSNTKIIPKDTHNIIDIEYVEINKINELIEKIPNLEILKYLKEFFYKIKESENEIFRGHEPESEKYSKNMKREKFEKFEKFNIYKHLDNLYTHIDDEINYLVRKITTDKHINKYKKIMSNIGDFKNLYEEYKIKHINDINGDEKSKLFRNNKKEEYLQFSIKFLNDVMNQIKHNKLSNPLNREMIRPQYRDFLNFGEKDKLFKILGDKTRDLYNFVKLIKSKQKYKVLFPELVSNVLHYLNIISLSNLFNILNSNASNTLIRQTDTESIEYNFKVIESDKYNKNNDDINIDTGLGMDEYMNGEGNGIDNDYSIDGNNSENTFNTEDKLDKENEINFIESFEIKNSDNLKIISEFILKYLDYIYSNQKTYDELTEKHIKNNITEFDQKKIERTLKTLKILNEEGNEERKKLLYIEMHILKKIDYSNISDYVDNMISDDTTHNGDSVDYYDEKPELDNDNNDNNNNDNNDDNFYKKQEMGNVISREDDDGDQDYGNLAVDDND